MLSHKGTPWTYMLNDQRERRQSRRRNRKSKGQRLPQMWYAGSRECLARVKGSGGEGEVSWDKKGPLESTELWVWFRGIYFTLRTETSPLLPVRQPMPTRWSLWPADTLVTLVTPCHWLQAGQMPGRGWWPRLTLFWRGTPLGKAPALFTSLLSHSYFCRDCTGDPRCWEIKVSPCGDPG